MRSWLCCALLICPLTAVAQDESAKGVIVPAEGGLTEFEQNGGQTSSTLARISMDSIQMRPSGINTFKPWPIRGSKAGNREPEEMNSLPST